MTFFRDGYFIVYNNSGSTINKGQAVYFSGTFSGSTSFVPTIALAKANFYATSAYGITAENISNGGYGRVQFSGSVSGFDLSGFAAGVLLYLSSTTAGGFTSVMPTAPNISQIIGYVVNNSVTGTIELLVKTPLNTSSGSYLSGFQLGPATGSSPVTLGFANSNLGTLSWNPSTSMTLQIPPNQGGTNTILQNDGTGVLSWQTSPSVMTANYDGGNSGTSYTAAIVIDGGTS
jgi:hypothetical protein